MNKLITKQFYNINRLNFVAIVQISVRFSTFRITNIRLGKSSLT